jgi:hypothetical protein
MKIAKKAVIAAAMLSSVALVGTVHPVFADDDVIYGRQLMTNDEMAEYHAKMQSLKTPEEREEYQLEHHQQMQTRAHEKGLTLPDESPAMGKGMGQGTGMGPGKGMGQGTGMGPGAGMGPGKGMGSGAGMGMGTGSGMQQQQQIQKQQRLHQQNPVPGGGSGQGQNTQ